jgi:hypothetical protein
MSLFRLDASIRVEGSHSRAIADVWNLDLKVVEADFTLVDVNPALDRFKDLARQLHQEADEQARRHGRELGAAVATTLAA